MSPHPKTDIHGSGFLSWSLCLIDTKNMAILDWSPSNLSVFRSSFIPKVAFDFSSVLKINHLSLLVSCLILSGLWLWLCFFLLTSPTPVYPVRLHVSIVFCRLRWLCNPGWVWGPCISVPVSLLLSDSLTISSSPCLATFWKTGSCLVPTWHCAWYTVVATLMSVRWMNST